MLIDYKIIDDKMIDDKMIKNIAETQWRQKKQHVRIDAFYQ